MNYLLQLCLVFAVYLVCEGIAAVLPIPFPASVLAMVALLLLLALRVVRPKQLEQCANSLLDHMSLFFVPVCVGVIDCTDVLLENFVPIVVICILTTPIVFFVTGHVVQLTMKLMQKRRDRT